MAASNTFGNIFKLTSFGESHGDALGGVIDGCPAGLTLNINLIQEALNRRRPGQSHIVTQRKEQDKVRLLSGLFDGKTTGTPIGFIIYNQDNKSSDYDHLKDVYRPSHADFTYQKKYNIRDHRGGGRSSARETVTRIVGGAVAQQFLSDIRINAYVSAVGNLVLDTPYTDLDFSNIEKNPVRCPDLDLAQAMETLIKHVRKGGDTVGGIVSCVIQNVPIGLGEPVAHKLHADLGAAMLSINAVKGFEYGSGFSGARMLGSEHNDLFTEAEKTKTNYSGGIQGGISNGMDIYFNVAFKPVATLMQTQPSISSSCQAIDLEAKGRHDPCVVPRAVPIVEAMAAMVLADHWLMQRTNRC